MRQGGGRTAESITSTRGHAPALQASPMLQTRSLSSIDIHPSDDNTDATELIRLRRGDKAADWAANATLLVDDLAKTPDHWKTPTTTCRRHAAGVVADLAIRRS